MAQVSQSTVLFEGVPIRRQAWMFDSVIPEEDSTWGDKSLLLMVDPLHLLGTTVALDWGSVNLLGMDYAHQNSYLFLRPLVMFSF